MKITLVIPKLSSGGAERVMSLMANYWAGGGHSVSLITLGTRETDFYAIDARVERVALDLMSPSSGLWSALNNNMERIKRLRNAIAAQKPDVVISFLAPANVITILAAFGLSVPVVISERIDPRQEYIGRAWETLRRVVYPKAHSLVVQTRHVQEWAREFVPHEKIRVIPNPVAMEPVTAKPDGNGIGRPCIAAMGRLVPQKGFDLLIEAFARCRDQSWSLLILGEGPERTRLQALVDKLVPGDRVCLPGTMRHPWAILAQADLFVLSSRYEGFPNALLEAMGCGLPVISFDCPSGPGEIIEQGVNGVLVPPGNVDALQDAMERLMGDAVERGRLAGAARKVTTAFAIDEVMKQWNHVLAEAT